MEPSEQIDALIARTDDWRGKLLADIRRAVLSVSPDIVETFKWMGTPTWESDGVIAIANPHKDKVKVTFSHGASLDDPDELFNNGFNGNVWRAIDFAEGDKLKLRPFKKLIKAAIEFNRLKMLERKSKARAKK
jgi:hypothetical protein